MHKLHKAKAVISSYHVSRKLLNEEQSLVQQAESSHSVAVHPVSLWTEIVQVSQPFCPRAHVATETDGLDTETLSGVLPGADEFHHQELGREANRGLILGTNALKTVPKYMLSFFLFLKGLDNFLWHFLKD